jgi:List-Bact-rpt repeat protein/fibronectin type III domain protein
MFCDPACSPYRNIFVTLVIGVGIFLIPNGVQSATSKSTTLQWAANQESDLAGYRVYHGTTSGSYGSPQDAGKATSYQYTNLEPNKTHYFSVTAFDHSGNESDPSPEVNTFIQAAVPPTLTSPKPNTTLEGETATFTWTPNETAVSKYYLEIGSAAHTDDLYDSGLIAANVLSRSVSGLPTDGRAVFVRFWWLVNGTWEVSRVEFAAAKGSISNFPLTISKSGGRGTITSNPIGLNCGSICTASFSSDSPVTLTANAASDSIFSGWSGGGCSGTGSCVLTLSSSTSVTANFASSPPPTSSLSVTMAGSGQGNVTGGVSCSSGTCSGTFPQGTSVTLTAAPKSGSTFSGWGGACTGTGSCVVVLSTSSASVSASFAASPPPTSSLSVTMAGSGQGNVTGGVSCSSGTCSGTFPQGTSVTLTAAPKSGSTFSGWGGACTGTGSCVVVLSTSSASVSATFASIPTVSRSLSVSFAGDGKGSVTSKPSGLTCSVGTCTASFPEGTTVTLTPATQSGSVFKGWNGVCSGTSNCAVTLSSSQAVTALFATENSNPPPMPDLPLLINFQASSSQVPKNFKKDDGSVFTSTRGYGWNKKLKGAERNSTADQTLDTFVSASNWNPGTWNVTIPNGTYYVTMALGDPKRNKGPHWVEAEGLQLAKKVKTRKGEYLGIVDYPVEVKDSTLSIKLGNSGRGQTVLNYLIINSAPNLPQTTQILSQSFGTTLITSVLISGSTTKVNPTTLVKDGGDTQEPIAAAQMEELKDEEMETLNQLKQNMESKRNSGGTVTLRNLFGGSR